MRGELLGLSGAKKNADEENKQLKRDLLASQQHVAALLSRVLGAAGAGAVGGPAAGPAVGGPGGPAAGGILAGLLGPGSASAPSGPPASLQQPQQQQLLSGAFDPNSFAAHLVSLRQGAPSHQQHHHHAARTSGGGAEGAVGATHEVRLAVERAWSLTSEKPVARPLRSKSLLPTGRFLSAQSPSLAHEGRFV